ncbi:ABC transporter permease [Rhodanobacter panaciterrae]|uniref:ABC transporter permease n=1 Tax=Rhodanobacter panaciterrae TaxID=490572 RepID=A0ABQ2ZP98_9GAMM|nr:ABC-2 transporter permease [Rhodanobacter panaciterrae]GGY21664.1 ABC transporter permease [Rhodanobacter panaciterrae]
MKTFYWLVKREFWEHRGGFFWAPIITGGVFLLLNIMGIITAEVLGAHHGINFGASGGLHNVMSDMDAGDMSKVGFALDLAMYSATGLLTVVLGFVVFFYCLGALYDDRRDRSILFWKSLPISDTSTVLSKIVSATVLAPIIAVIVGIVVGILQLLILAITLSFHGVNVWHLLLMAHPFRIVFNLIGYIPLYVLWALPSVGWLLLCSAWARNKPFLWAVALPVATGLIISWFGLMGLFNLPTTWFWKNVVQRGLFSTFPGTGSVFGTSGESIAHNVAGNPNMDFMDLTNTYQLLASSNLWIGVVIGSALLAGAIWFRRWRDDS